MSVITTIMQNSPTALTPPPTLRADRKTNKKGKQK